ncbi:conserved hypothetical protein [delta proteobacterium NaphS2]|nr:conserved hypothetical protein [delta proteobacterium NaphS2]
MDVWIAVSEMNAEKTAAAIREFGMPADQITKDLFLASDKVIRMGVPPVRIEVITGASGVDFETCYARRQQIEIDGIPVNFICLDDLKKNIMSLGLLMSPLPMATICCSPPLRVPAF